MDKKEQLKNAQDILIGYTVGAAITGAVVVPASSTAIVAENGIMISHIASVLEEDITLQKVISSISVAGILNIVGRQIFIEIAKLLSWGTGSWWALPMLVCAGATTAGIQTYIIGRIAIEIGKNSGKNLDPDKARETIKQATKEFAINSNCWKKTVKPIFSN